MSHGLTTDTPISRSQILALRVGPAHVVGATSAEGVAVVRLLRHLGFEHVVVHDMRERADLRRAFRTTHGAYSRIEQDELWEELRPVFDVGCFGDDYLTGMEDASLVVLGQGWYLDPTNRERVVAAVPAGARIASMVDLYFALHRGPVAAITGTNGKSTTAALAEHLLSVADIPHRTAGNERSSRQFLPQIDEVEPGTWALLEISNRQLLQLARSPQVAAITALTPDHLDEHDGFDGYRATKARLFAHQNEHDVAIANADDSEALRVAARSVPARVDRLVRCGLGDHPAPCVTWRDGVLVAEDVPLMRGDGRREGQSILASTDDMRMPGDHNLRNAAVAVALALACGADPTRIAEGLRTFEGKALRLQQLEELDGVSIWSDLKSTTPEATVAALDALAGRRVGLILGGDDKGLDYAPLARAILAADVHAYAVEGSATDALEAELVRLADGAPAPFERVADLAEGLDRALDAAVSGDCVIVSPAAAGFWTRQLQGSVSLRTLVRRRATALQEVSDR